MTLRYKAAAAATLLGLSAPLLVAGSAESAAKTTGSVAISATRATAGETLTFRGRVSGGSRPVIAYRVYAGNLVTKVAGRSTSNGTFSISRRMSAMPQEYYKVVAPATRTRKKWTSKTFTVQNQMQGTALTRSGSTFTARLTLTTNGTTRSAGAGRTVVLQRRSAPGSWTTLAGQSGETDANGAVSFRVTEASGTYRALARQTRTGVSPLPSFPVSTSEPTLDLRNVADPGGSTLSPMPASGNGAAAKYNWWPVNGFWDTELGEGMNGPGDQGCTGHCTPWSEYATGSGRVAIVDGQIALDTGSPGRSQKVWGDLSSTLQLPGYATGRWEMRMHHKKLVPGRTPYTSRVSMVPAGTPDGTTPAKRIVLAEWTGYDDKTRLELGQGDGKPVLRRTVAGIQQNARNWHNLAVQVTDGTIVWLIDGNVVGQASGAATSGTRWVPRIEMLDTAGQWMERSRGGIDWVRYFTLDRKRAKALPTGPSLG